MDDSLYHLYHKEENDWWWVVGRRALVKVGGLSRGGSNLKLDYTLVPSTVTRVLSGVIRLEARPLAHASLPLGTSIACVAVKPDAGA